MCSSQRRRAATRLEEAEVAVALVVLGAGLGLRVPEIHDIALALRADLVPAVIVN